MVVLCIDNDPEDIEFFCEAVNEVDPAIKVLSALNGPDALDLLNSLDNKELPAYIFLDINMPRMNGNETLKEIRKTDRYHAVQVVMLSTGLNPRDPSQYKDLGATHFMAKANSLRELCNKLTVLLSTNAVQ